MATVALRFAAVGMRVIETEQERVREASEGRDARRPLQLMLSHNAALPQRVHTMRWPRPVAGRPRCRLIQSV